MMSTAAVPFGGGVAGSVLGVARENDEGALRALCQVCSTAGVAETRKVSRACGFSESEWLESQLH